MKCFNNVVLVTTAPFSHKIHVWDFNSNNTIELRDQNRTEAFKIFVKKQNIFVHFRNNVLNHLNGAALPQALTR